MAHVDAHRDLHFRDTELIHQPENDSTGRYVLAVLDHLLNQLFATAVTAH